MTTFEIPEKVQQDLDDFSEKYNDFLSGKIDKTLFKSFHVPFGVYEQREANTYMVRVKPVAGIITPKQLRVLGEIAISHGDGRVHVTTRGGAQIHHVTHDRFLEVIQALHQAGLTGRGGGGNTVRNIVVDSYAGIAEDEYFDVTPHAVALTMAMMRLGDSYALPRKFKFAFSGSSADRAGASYTDVGFIARLQDGQRGFHVFVGGGLGTKSRVADSFIDFLPENDTFIVSQAIKEIFNEKGNRQNRHKARLRFLIEELGLETFKELVFERIKRLRMSEISFGISAEKKREITKEAATISDKDAILGKEKQLWWHRYVVPQKQKHLYCAKLPLLLGDIDGVLATALAEKLGSLVQYEDVIRFAADQNIYLRNLTQKQLLKLYPLLRRIAPLQRKAPIIGNIIVCTGASTCQLGVTMPRGALPAIERALTNARINLDALGDIKIHLSGCPNNCGKHVIADLGFFGKVLRKNGIAYPAYSIFVGGKVSETETKFAHKIADVSAFYLPKFIVSVLKSWLAVKQRYHSFSDWVAQGGEQVIVGCAHALSDIPDFSVNQAPYFDYSSNVLFSVKKRGAENMSADVQSHSGTHT
jgi:sulfite reductase (ferredoxin)